MPRVDLDGLSPRDVERVACFAADLRRETAGEPCGVDGSPVTAFTRARRPYPLTSPPNPLVCAQNESESQIRNALCYSEELAAQLHSEIASIEHRLETGLTPIPPSPACTNAGGPDVTCRSHVLERVGGLNAALAAAVARVRELRMRVEL